RGHQGAEFPKGTIKLTTDANLGQIDWLLAGCSDSHRGSKIFGIYKLEGKQLWLCLGDFDGRRPSEFEQGPREFQPGRISTVQYVLERDDPNPPMPPPAEEGSWKIEHWRVYPDPRARFAEPPSPEQPNSAKPQQPGQQQAGTGPRNSR